MTGLSRSTLNRATKSGRLSAHRDEAGAILIDASELARVYGVTSPEPVQRRAMTSHDEPRDEAVAVLETKVAMLTDQLERGDRERTTILETVEDLRRRLDRAEERVLALTAQPTPAQESPAVVEEVHRPLEESPAVVEELHRRLEESRAHIRALMTAPPTAQQAAQEGPIEMTAWMSPAGSLRGFLARLWGRG